jgi:hypothetical protein
MRALPHEWHGVTELTRVVAHNDDIGIPITLDVVIPPKAGIQDDETS